MLFIHIPKTAGTSFRKGAEQYFGSGNVFYDYGDSAETSSIIKNKIYNESDFFSFYTSIGYLEGKFLSGHINANKYIDCFGTRNTVVFLRDPIQRIMSEYQHFVRNNGYKGDFRSFYTKPNFVNRQKKILSGIPTQAIGFIGLTERYEDSLEQINSLYNTNIPNLQLNKGRPSTESNWLLEPETIEEITKLNQEDIEFYEKWKSLFEQRTILWKSGKPFAHAAIQQINRKSVTGWAWWDKSDEPVAIRIVCEDHLLGETVARDLRPGLLRLSPPRRGYVGFHFEFPDDLPAGAEISCFVKDTSQLIDTGRIKGPSE